MVDRSAEMPPAPPTAVTWIPGALLPVVEIICVPVAMTATLCCGAWGDRLPSVRPEPAPPLPPFALMPLSLDPVPPAPPMASMRIAGALLPALVIVFPAADCWSVSSTPSPLAPAPPLLRGELSWPLPPAPPTCRSSSPAMFGPLAERVESVSVVDCCRVAPPCPPLLLSQPPPPAPPVWNTATAPPRLLFGAEAITVLPVTSVVIAPAKFANAPPTPFLVELPPAWLAVAR